MIYNKILRKLNGVESAHNEIDSNDSRYNSVKYSIFALEIVLDIPYNLSGILMVILIWRFGGFVLNRQTKVTANNNI